MAYKRSFVYVSLNFLHRSKLSKSTSCLSSLQNVALRKTKARLLSTFVFYCLKEYGLPQRCLTTSHFQDRRVITDLLPMVYDLTMSGRSRENAKAVLPPLDEQMPFGLLQLVCKVHYNHTLCDMTLQLNAGRSSDEGLSERHVANSFQPFYRRLNR